MEFTLDFERPLVELEQKIVELQQLPPGEIDFSDEISRLQEKAAKIRDTIFAELTPWQIVQLARHPQRPYTLDYINALMTDFVELHGDRSFRDDPSIVAGTAYFCGQAVMVMGHQKGRGTKENMMRNFGMSHPEGYRKAKRLMEMAAKFKLPIITLIDTSGAYPGIGAEERGQAEAIAKNLEIMAGLPVPIISAVIGEGGSGGALALGVANRVLMMQYAIYSVISPEGCASILYKDGSRASEAAQSLHLCAQHIFQLKVADEIIPEPPGGAHRQPQVAIQNLGEALARHLAELRLMSAEQILEQRYQKFRAAGAFSEQ